MARADSNKYYLKFGEDDQGYFVILSHTAENDARCAPNINGDIFLAFAGEKALLASVNVTGGDYMATFCLDVYIPNGIHMIDKYTIEENLFLFKFDSPALVHRLEHKEAVSCDVISPFT